MRNTRSCTVDCIQVVLRNICKEVVRVVVLGGVPVVSAVVELVDLVVRSAVCSWVVVAVEGVILMMRGMLKGIAWKIRNFPVDRGHQWPV